MVFPSLGCQTCRKRKVKCDSARPICRRCHIGNRNCNWDSDEQTGLHFRNENAYAKGYPRRPRQMKACEEQPGIDSGPRAAPVSSHGTIKPALSLPLEMHTLYYAADSFRQEKHMPAGPGQEFGSFVLSHLELAEPNSALRLAMTAYSNAVFARQKCVEHALSLARRAYAKSMRQIQTEIQTISGRNNVYQAALAMMLMGSYENVMYFLREPTPSASHDGITSHFWDNVCHEKGAAALLSAHREEGLARNTTLEKVIRQKCLRILILRGESMPDWLNDGTKWGEEGPELELDLLMTRTLVLRHRSLYLSKAMYDAAPDMTEKTMIIATEADTLDRNFTSWLGTLPQSWHFGVSWVPTQSTGSNVAAPPNFPQHIYASVGSAAIWNRYRALRLITNRIHQRALLSLQPPVGTNSIGLSLWKCQDNINTLAGDMCSGAQFLVNYQNSKTNCHKGDVKGNGFMISLDSLHPGAASSLAWPLTVALSVESVPSLERTWLTLVLKAAARVLGHTLLESVTNQEEFRF